jgi:hypothetical protein
MALVPSVRWGDPEGALPKSPGVRCMVICPTCNAEADDEAKFCCNCGTKLQRSGPLSDFEIGKIAALDSIKKDTLKWIGGSASIIGVAFALLAYFGLNETLKSSVAEQVKAELKQNKDDIDKAIKELYVALGKADKDQEKINKLFTDSLTMIAKVTDNESQLKSNTDDAIAQLHFLKDSITTTDSERKELESIIKKLNIASLINKLKYDFYHVRDFRGSLDVVVNPTINKIHGFDAIIDLYQVRTGDDGKIIDKQLAEFGHNTVTATRDRNNNVMRLQSKFFVFQPFEDKIFNHEISEFEQVDVLEIRMILDAEDNVSIDQVRSSLENIHFIISVNWMPLWEFDIDNNNITRTERNDGKCTLWIRKQNSIDVATITQKYESLFTEKDVANANNENK